jgi:hypothetical protein
MENRESFQSLLDVNSREIKIGSFGRLSEKGRKFLSIENPKLINNYPNLRFNVLDINISSSKILVKLEDLENIKLILNSDLIVIENS